MAPMTLFDYLRPKDMAPLKAQPLVKRTVLIKADTPADIARRYRARLSSTISPAPSAVSKTKQAANQTKKRTASPKKGSASPAPTKKGKRKRPARTAVVSSDSDSSDDEVKKQRRKKQKSVDSASSRTTNRQLRYQKDAKGSEDETDVIKHAQEVVSGPKASSYANWFEGDGEMVVELQYPGDLEPEKYLLVRPRDKDDFDPVLEILRVTGFVPKFYLSKDQANNFINENTGFNRKLKLAVARKLLDTFRGVLTDYNQAIKTLYDDDTVANNLDKMRELPLQLVEHILTQIYARTVSLKVDTLRKYENGTDNVYGELLPRFASMIFKETGLTSDKVFIDLGSGVGNVVLQAALEIGCESWGCEVMDNACDLAALQEKEFRARCRAWGLATGDVHLERGDFLTSSKIREVLPKADVILVNNQAFTPQLNDNLVNLFLDLKEGCRIVSLKSFVPAGHKITKRNINSAVNVLEVEEKQYFSDCVSWTNAPGEYFVATKDSRKLKAFIKKNGKDE